MLSCWRKCAQNAATQSTQHVSACPYSMDGNAVTQSIHDSDPNRAWVRLPMEGNQLRVGGR